MNTSIPSTSTSSRTSPSTTAVSAPGKVLLAGGYLVVDRAHTGLVFGLSARIHVLVRGAENRASSELAPPSSVAASSSSAAAAPPPLPPPPPPPLPQDGAVIVVRSPQFRGVEWRYRCAAIERDDEEAEIGKEGGVNVVQDVRHSASRNKFVETTLLYVLNYVSAQTDASLEPCSVTILADADYYSQAETSSACVENAESPFVNFNVALGDAHKTGLGSSAALVTALTAALVLHYLPHAEGKGLEEASTKLRIHNLAQAAHCTAQGKIGSGFDVAAAVFGSCLYRRFSPAILEGLGAAGSKGFRSRLKAAIDEVPHKVWNTEIDPSAVKLPNGLRLVMCDVDCGSETPGMVKKVFEWRKRNPDRASSLWAELQKANEDLANELCRLAASKALDDQYEALRRIILRIRSFIREMSTEAEVQIEPKVQTDLLDACSQIPGVVGGVVPGAGGFDALAFLIVDEPEVLRSLAVFVEAYKAPAEDHGASIGKVRLLGVRQEMEGVRKESTELYRGWL